jgi:hypothetical protein
MQINAKFPIINLNKQNLYYMERSTYGHMQTTHTTMPQMSSFKIIQKKLMKSQFLVMNQVINAAYMLGSQLCLQLVNM